MKKLPSVLLFLAVRFAISAEPMQAISKEPLHFPSVPPVPAADTGKTFEVLHDFQMQLIASEPMVESPVAVTYDEDGRAFVCEMTDYPYTDKAHHKPSQENPTDAPIGKVRMLVDTDGDGVFDKSTIFADGLSWPTGAVCWKGGIIVVATPDIWYFKDTKGTGVADVRIKLFTGLKKLNVQAVANNPIWGLDNKIYIAGGSNGGTLQNLVHPEEKLITFRRNDLILDPVKMTIELASGGARFGNTRDDWGNRFLCNIRNPLEHVVIDQHYLARNPYLPPTSPLQDVAESGDQLPVYRISPTEAWRDYRAKRWSADPAVTAHMPRSELVGAGVVTSSSGCTIYRGDAYPAEYRGMAFVCECAGNLFYRLKLTPEGVTFKGTRIDGNKEMVASRDLWFRPVNFCNAPDGCLTVCDMYREVIEHPWSLPDDIHAALNLERGRDKGRLYRLAPPGFKTHKVEPLGKKSTTELVALLAHPNAWHRDTAHRLLFERQDMKVAPLLSEMAENHENPLARMEALWAMDGLQVVTERTLLRALQDKTGPVQEAAMQISESWLWTHQALLEAVTAQSTTGGPRLAFRTALAMGEPKDNAAQWDALVRIVGKYGDDPLMRSAVLSSTGKKTPSLLLMMWHGEKPSMQPEMIVDAAGISGALPDAAANAQMVIPIFQWLDLTGQQSLSERALTAFLVGLQKSGRQISDLGDMALPVIPNGPPTKKEWLAAVAERKTRMALDAAAPVEDRASAVGLLALLEFVKLQPIAARLLLPSEPDAVRLAAIKLLGQQRDSKVANLLLDAWPTLTPAPREAALQVFAGRAPMVAALLSAIEEGKIKAAEISPTARTLLSRLSDAKLRDRAAKVFSGSASRQEVIAKYQGALSLKGDAEAGHKVYQTICAACHRKGEEGRDIGPNLATILNWTADQILVNVLDPNREVVANFLLYIVETNDGRTLSGLITNETAGSIGLKGADGVEQSVSRTEIKSLKSTGLSLMPEGLEAAITPQQMADVIAFLRG